MAIEIKLKRNENIDRALKRLKRMMDKDGIVQELKDRRYFVKPGDKKRKKSAQAQARKRKEDKIAQSLRSA